MKYHLQISGKIQEKIDYPSCNVCECDYIIAIGGDGQLLRTLSLASKNNKPIIGINKGNVGFLMHHISLDNINHSIQNAIQYTAPSINIDNIDHVYKNGWNDIVIAKNGYHLILLDVYIDNKLINIQPIKCDGIIISTQLGSSAYHCSNGGTILPIEASDFININFIAPYNYTLKNQIVHKSTKIKIVNHSLQYSHTIIDNILHKPQKENIITLGNNHAKILLPKTYLQNIQKLNTQCKVN